MVAPSRGGVDLEGRENTVRPTHNAQGTRVSHACTKAAGRRPKSVAQPCNHAAMPGALRPHAGPGCAAMLNRARALRGG